MENSRILIADDNKRTRDFVAAFLRSKGCQVFHAMDGQDALDKVATNEVHLVVTDLMMPRVNGLELVQQVKALRPDIVTIVYSAFGHYEMTTNLLRSGVFFYLEKPFRLEELEMHVRRGLEHHRLQRRSYKNRPCIRNDSLLDNISSESDQMLSLLELTEKVADTDLPVLIRGEPGTGKEMVARVIHNMSGRKDKPFTAVNCADIPVDLVENQLFGYVKRHAGTIVTRAGYLETADKGTLYLSGLTEVRPALQSKLHKVLRDKELEPFGAAFARTAVPRVIVGTSQNLEKLVVAGEFSKELHDLLSLIPLRIPPLRERACDIPLLLNSFLEKFNREKKRKVKGFDRSAMAVLCGYYWPKNVRELKGLVEQLVVTKGSGVITCRDLPDKFLAPKPPAGVKARPLPDEGICLNSAVEELENNLILQALEKTGGNKKEAAALLNLKRTTLM